MQLIRLIAVPFMLCANPALACGIALNTSGILAPSADFTRMGSSEPGGVAATFTVSNTLFGGDFRVTVDPPVLNSAPPAGFNTGTAQYFVSYTGIGLLSFVSQGYTAGSSHFDVPGLLGALAVVMTLHNRITNSSGLASGTYQTKTVITCS
ncbi:MAG: hypothetical protein ABIQ30_03620 [Devosia sp.]